MSYGKMFSIFHCISSSIFYQKTYKYHLNSNMCVISDIKVNILNFIKYNFNI